MNPADKQLHVLVRQTAAEPEDYRKMQIYEGTNYFLDTSYCAKYIKVIKHDNFHRIVVK